MENGGGGGEGGGGGSSLLQVCMFFLTFWSKHNTSRFFLRLLNSTFNVYFNSVFVQSVKCDSWSINLVSQSALAKYRKPFNQR